MQYSTSSFKKPIKYYLKLYHHALCILGVHTRIPSASAHEKSNNLDSSDDDDAMEQLILDQCRKIAWAEKGTTKVTPFRQKVILLLTQYTI